VTDLAPLLLAGAVAGCAALLILAGAGKVYRSRRVPEESAIQRALRIGPGPWWRVQLAIGVAELVTGVAVLVRIQPLVAGIAMAAQGAVFSATLAYVRYAKIRGACGCVLPSAKQRVTWRDQARAVVVLGGGIVAATAHFPPLWTPSFGLVALVGAVVTVVLAGVDQSWQTPVCHRRWWRPMWATVADLRRHPVYARMTAAGDLVGETFGHRRSGCTDEFWFPTTAEGMVFFRVTRSKPTHALAVHAWFEAEAPAERRRFHHVS
jgi:hypothetical protein